MYIFHSTFRREKRQISAMFAVNFTSASCFSFEQILQRRGVTTSNFWEHHTRCLMICQNNKLCVYGVTHIKVVLMTKNLLLLLMLWITSRAPSDALRWNFLPGKSFPSLIDFYIFSVSDFHSTSFLFLCQFSFVMRRVFVFQVIRFSVWAQLNERVNITFYHHFIILCCVRR